MKLGLKVSWLKNSNLEWQNNLLINSDNSLIQKQNLLLKVKLFIDLKIKIENRFQKLIILIIFQMLNN